MRNLNNKGISRTALIVMILLLAVVIGVVVFGQFIEQSRATEAENIINLASAAQGRQLMTKGRYATTWKALDIAPIAPHLNKVGKYINQEGTVYLTKGGGFAKPNSGFKMYFEEVNRKTYLVAKRMNWRYDYTLVRPLGEETTYCVPSTGPKMPADKSFCKEFMAIEGNKELPQDPRTIEEEYNPYW